MNCDRCGYELDTDYDFCCYCGKRISLMTNAQISRPYAEPKAVPKAASVPAPRAASVPAPKAAPVPAPKAAPVPAPKTASVATHSPAQVKKTGIAAAAVTAAPASGMSEKAASMAINKEKVNYYFDNSVAKVRKAADMYKNVPKDNHVSDILGAIVAIVIALILMFVGSLDIKGMIRKYNSSCVIMHHTVAEVLENDLLP